MQGLNAALLILLPIVGGHIFASSWYLTKYRCQREDGHRVYFSAIFYGLFLFLTAFFLRLILLSQVDGYAQFERSFIELFVALSEDFENSHKTPIAIVGMYALFLGAVLWIPLNRVVGKKQWIWAAIRSDDFERLFYRSVMENLPISLTMQNGKIYIGFVTSTIEPERDRLTLAILPMISGYRDKETNRMVLTTYYDDFYAAVSSGKLPGREMENFEIVLLSDQILSANIFDIDAYELVRSDTESAPGETAEEGFAEEGTPEEGEALSTVDTRAGDAGSGDASGRGR